MELAELTSCLHLIIWSSAFVQKQDGINFIIQLHYQQTVSLSEVNSKYYSDLTFLRDRKEPFYRGMRWIAAWLCLFTTCWLFNVRVNNASDWLPAIALIWE
jgi:hypothetical protein